MSFFDDNADIWKAPDDLRFDQVQNGAATPNPPTQDLGNGVTQTAAPGYHFENGNLVKDDPNYGKPGFPGGPPLPDTVQYPNGAPNGSAGRMDEAAIRSQIAQWAAMPGADPSLSNDPDYWVKAITSRGGLGADNTQYWQNASVGPTAFFNNPNRESGNTPAAAPLSQIGAAPPSTTFTPPPAPTYTPYVPTAAPTPQHMAAPTPFVAPTAEQARATPGYQAALDQANRAEQASAAARGGLLSGGAIRETAQLNTDLSDQNYQNVYNNALAANNSNFGQAFNVNQANNGADLNSWQANTNAGLSAAGLNLQGTNQQFQNTYLPLWNAYQSNVGQQQFGANFGLNANQQAFGQDLSNRQFGLQSQNQFWNQGLQENENAYSQYDTSQKAAFDQWYKTAQLGNPGNPYA